MKKMKKISYKITSIARDYGMSVLLNHYNLQTVLTIYNVVTATPLDIVIYILSIKLGMSKMAIMVILAFLL